MDLVQDGSKDYSYQWPALNQVTLGAQKPGDLLHYYNLDGGHQVDHLVMNVGSGP